MSFRDFTCYISCGHRPCSLQAANSWGDYQYHEIHLEKLGHDVFPRHIYFAGCLWGTWLSTSILSMYPHSCGVIRQYMGFVSYFLSSWEKHYMWCDSCGFQTCPRWTNCVSCDFQSDGNTVSQCFDSGRQAMELCRSGPKGCKCRHM